MKSNLGYIVSAFIIGLSLIVGAYILADGWRSTSVSGETRGLYDGNKNVMNDDELAAYLRITSDDLKKSLIKIMKRKVSYLFMTGLNSFLMEN